MEYSYNTAGDSLYDDIDGLCTSTSATYPIADKRRNILAAYNQVNSLIWESAGGWQYDDSNRTTLPVAQSTLVHNQQDYSLPTSSQRIERVQIKDNGGTWRKLKAMDSRDVRDEALEEFGNEYGTPVYYDLVGRSINLYPIPTSASVTLASGISVTVSRDVSAFASASSAEPGFAKQFHRILSLAAAIDFTKDASENSRFRQMKERLETGLTRFYSKRAEENKTQIAPRGKRNWRQYT